MALGADYMASYECQAILALPCRQHFRCEQYGQCRDAPYMYCFASIYFLDLMKWYAQYLQNIAIRHIRFSGQRILARFYVMFSAPKSINSQYAICFLKPKVLIFWKFSNSRLDDDNHHSAFTTFCRREKLYTCQDHKSDLIPIHTMIFPHQSTLRPTLVRDIWVIKCMSNNH